MKIIWAITKAIKRSNPNTAIEPDERNRASEFAIRELGRFSLAGRIVLDETFNGLILGGIFCTGSKLKILVFGSNYEFANLEPTSQKHIIN